MEKEELKFSAAEVESFFRGHWTVRKYKPVAMPPQHLEAILFAAQRAPTDATAQLYSLVRLVNLDLRKKVAELSGNPHIVTASEAFMVCVDFYKLARLFKINGKNLGRIPRVAVHFGIGDAVLAGQNLLLASEMLGYRGCWIGGVLNALEAISELIGLPARAFPFAGLTIGVPDEDPKFRPRLPRKQVVHVDKYDIASDEEFQKGALEMASITARGDWVQTLARYFAEGGTMEAREKMLTDFLNKKFSGEI